jgi:hypothetical protein
LELTGLRPTLRRVVQRVDGEQVWLLDEGRLFRVTPDAVRVGGVRLPGAAERMSLLERRDRLVLESASGDRLWLLDPDRGAIEREMALDCGGD